MAENMPGAPNNPDRPMQFTGKPPPQFFSALQEIKNQQKEEIEEQKKKNPFADVVRTEVPMEAKAEPPKEVKKPVQQKRPQTQMAQKKPRGSAKLQDLIEGLMEKGVRYDEIVLPSRGVFYDGKTGPSDGVLHIREMTGDEEQILATPKYVRKGVAVNMIFERCIRENFKTENFLSIDRTYLLVSLRSLSYGDNYEVDIKCPDCEKRFPHTIPLKDLIVNYCPDDFGPPLQDTLPKSEYNFTWHLACGKDENAVQTYRDVRLKEYGSEASDDSLMYRIALMLDEVEGLTNKVEIKELLKRLPVQDIAYLRNLALDTPFGLDTKLQITCAACYHDFEVELPLEAGFFFPRQKHKTEETNSDSTDS
jgi:hypothetical protein